MFARVGFRWRANLTIHLCLFSEKLHLCPAPAASRRLSGKDNRANGFDGKTVHVRES